MLTIREQRRPSKTLRQHYKLTTFTDYLEPGKQRFGVRPPVAPPGGPVVKKRTVQVTHGRSGPFSGSHVLELDGIGLRSADHFTRLMPVSKAVGGAFRLAMLPIRLTALGRATRDRLDGRGGWTQRNAAAPYFWAALQLVGDGR